MHPDAPYFIILLCLTPDDLVIKRGVLPLNDKGINYQQVLKIINECSTFFHRTPAVQHGVKNDWAAGDCKPSSPFKPQPVTRDAQIEGNCDVHTILISLLTLHKI